MTRIIGPTGSKRRRRFLLVPLLLSTVAFAVFFVGAARAVLPGSQNKFEANDGNMTLGTSGNTDWNCFKGTDNFQPGSPPTGCATNSGASNEPADPNGEINFQGGAKFDDVCPALGTGNNPPKDEFIDVSSFSDSNPATHDTFFYGATERTSPNGNTEGAIELDHNKGNGTTQLTCRVSGDRLVEYQFLNGGTSLQFQVVTWIKDLSDTSGGNNTPPFSGCLVKTDSPPCFGAAIITSQSGTFLEGSSNNVNPIAAADNGINGLALDVNQFAEFGANLTQILGLQGKCVSLPQQVFESKASGSSFTSQPKDVEITNTNIQTCGEVVIIKRSDPRGQSASFSYTSSITGGELVAGSASGVSGVSCREAASGFSNPYTLSDAGNASSDSPGNTNDCANVPQGTYTVTEGAEPPGFTFEGLSCTSTGGSSTTTSGTKATITVVPGGVTTCVYTNQAQGEIKIIKHTDPRGIDQSFSYSSNVSGNASFSLNDKGNTSGDSSGNTNDMTNVAPGIYTVNETGPPNGWTLESLSCTASGTGSSGKQNGATPTQADITLGAGGLVTCTYVNKPPSGAILITKTGKDKACTGKGTPTITNGVCTGVGTAALTGASFSITGTDLLGNPISKTATTGADGTACVDGLPWNGSGNSFNVSETKPPTGYSEDPSNTDPATVSVTQNANCSDSTKANAAPVGFNDIPLTDLTVNAQAEVGGATNSTVTCTDALNAGIGNSPQGPSDPAKVTANGLKPGTYTCTVVIDP
jgi:hypothetical protein